MDAIDINAALEKTVPTEVLLPEAYIYEQVKAALKPNEVLVDFFVTDETYISDKYFYELCQLDTTSIGDQLQTFAMSICKADWSKPKVVPLYLDSAIDFFAITQERATNAVRDTQLGKRFWGQVIKEADVESGDVIYITPTGNINTVPIEYLKIDEGVHVSDKYEIYRLTSWRQLLHPSSKITRDDSWALYVDDYFAYDVRVNTKCSTENQELRTLKTTDLPPLYGATNTYHHINRNGVAVVTKYNNDFTEYEFSRLNLKSPELIYIGSHGYFLDDNLTAQDSLYLYGKYRNYALSSEEKSMYRSGIIMREAPGYQMVMSNKFLTAKEISLLDLSTTKLACVSACSTGLGKISAEGVYGLQRGFKLAGVQSLLVSLWDVDDKATEILISAFYDNLRLGQSKYAALNNAQASVRNYSQADSGSINLGEEAIFADPYYWAGFVLIDGNE